LDYKDPKPFRFNQFEVHHHLSTFKVNTDGVLLGCSAEVSNPKTALDIGTGSGMIALMLAQKYPTLYITGIEIDKNSAAQAQYNGQQSPFAERVDIINADCFEHDYQQKYDLIVCNPPYFVGGTLPNDANLSLAKHHNSEFIDKLISLVAEILMPDGKCYFLYPYSQDESIQGLIKSSPLNLTAKTLLKSYADSEPYACIYCMQHTPTSLETKSLNIYAAKGVKSEEYERLVGEFH
jgi:tRNA1Val (adenine37-N6)-methyltransferase